MPYDRAYVAYRLGSGEHQAYGGKRVYDSHPGLWPLLRWGKFRRFRKVGSIYGGG